MRYSEFGQWWPIGGHACHFLSHMCLVNCLLFIVVHAIFRVNVHGQSNMCLVNFDLLAVVHAIVLVTCHWLYLGGCACNIPSQCVWSIAPLDNCVCDMSCTACLVNRNFFAVVHAFIYFGHTCSVDRVHAILRVNLLEWLPALGDLVYNIPSHSTCLVNDDLLTVVHAFFVSQMCFVNHRLLTFVHAIFQVTVHTWQLCTQYFKLLYMLSEWLPFRDCACLLALTLLFWTTS